MNIRARLSIVPWDTPLTNLLNNLRDYPDLKELWAEEQELREAEAAADDLPRVKLQTSAGDIVLELFKRYLLHIQPLLELTEDQAREAEDLWLRLHLIFEAMGRFRFLFRDLNDLHARIRNLRRAFNGLLGRQRNTLLRLIKGLRNNGVAQIGDREAEALADNMLLVMTYWIPFVEVRGDPGLADGSVLSEAVARVLYLVLPYLREPEAGQVEALAHTYRDL